VPILKSATPNNLICLGERNPSPRCRERRCIRSGYDRAGEFRREQGSCSPSRGEPAKGCCSSARGDEFPRLIGSTAEGERQTSESSRRASAERRSFHPSPQRHRSGRRSAGRRRRILRYANSAVGSEPQRSAETAALHRTIEGETAEAERRHLVTRQAFLHERGRACIVERRGAQRVEAEDTPRCVVARRRNISRRFRGSDPRIFADLTKRWHIVIGHING
jgi:hypothetical protein